MTITVLRNARLFDGLSRDIRAGMGVIVEDAFIREVFEGEPSVQGDIAIDCGARTLMPGLIDAHVHILATDVDLASLDKIQKSLLYAQSRHVLEGMLARGFTTIRDAGGADAGFAAAVEQGFIDGPRMYVAGAALTQTGGHADMRARMSFGCACHGLSQGSILGRIADGVPDVRHAARDELRMGATHIKVMASGGAASPTDPIENTQYSLDELRAIVEEAEAWNTYVMGHAYTPRAIIRAIECGIRSIEHGNLLDESAAIRMRELNAFLVPTLVSSDTLVRFGAELGSPAESMRKIRQVRDKGIEALDIARRCKTKIGFGTDILGLKLHNYQGEEFMLRSRVEDPVDTLISATSINADMMMQKGRIGEITAGARADILVVNGDPASDATTFNQQGVNLDVIMKDGRFFKNTLC